MTPTGRIVAGRGTVSDLGANRDPYGRRSHRYGGGFDQEVSRHQPMPYEAAAYDDLASKANRAAAQVQRHADEAEDAFQGRVQAARASVLGLTRNAGEAMEGFRARIEEALSSAADSARSLAASAGDSASRLADRGREAVQGFYEQGASALHGVRDRAGDAAGQVRHFSSRTIDYVQEQPLLLGALGITVGAAIGMLLPSSRYERRMAASLRDSLGESARQVVGEAGQSVARVAESVLDTAQEATRREGFVDTEGRDLAAVAREKVADVAGRARHVVEEVRCSRSRGGAARARGRARPCASGDVPQWPAASRSGWSPWWRARHPHLTRIAQTSSGPARQPGPRRGVNSANVIDRFGAGGEDPAAQDRAAQHDLKVDRLCCAGCGRARYAR